MSFPEPSDATQTAPSTHLPYSVLICTRNRGNSLVPTVRSIFATEVPCDELLIIDQSSDTATQHALAPFADDPRLRYIHTLTQGKGKALNLGLQLARFEIVAITDDDCEVAPDWPRQHLAAFARYPQVTMTYGNVLPVDHDPIKGFIPTYYVNADRLVTTLPQKLSARGIGANTAVRRTTILDLGGFDAQLCPGGKFKACVDRDMTIRCLLGGFHIYESCDSKVYHYGFRNWDQGRVLACNAFYGLGAAHVKPLKYGRYGVLLLLVWEVMAYALLPALWATLTWSRPFGWNRAIYFLRGMRDGLKTPVDTQYIRYQGETKNAQTSGDAEPEVCALQR